MERQSIEAEDRQDEYPLTVDLAGLVENIERAAKKQVAYMVDVAKANALTCLTILAKRWMWCTITIEPVTLGQTNQAS